jgi:hypothetical protein
VSLRDLVLRSTRIVRGTPLDAFTRAETIGDTRHIVTYSRLGIDEWIHGASSESEILVRTLGGRLNDVAELVPGEALLIHGEPCVAFLQTNPDGIELVTAMAQGHYPLALDATGAPRLRASGNMPHLVGSPGSASAVVQLAGTRFSEARALILGAK